MTVTTRMPGEGFFISIEVVPPAGPDAEPLLTSLAALDGLPFDAFSVATNPVAKPRMSAMALCALLQHRTGHAAILHCTTRDHNRLSLQGLLWGARALGIETVLITTGDFVALGDRKTTSDVRDIDLFALVAMANEAGFNVGVVLDPHPESDGLPQAVQRLAQPAGTVGVQRSLRHLDLDQLGHAHARAVLAIGPTMAAMCIDRSAGARERGFTLVELMAVVAILSILMALATRGC